MARHDAGVEVVAAAGGIADDQVDGVLDRPEAELVARSKAWQRRKAEAGYGAVITVNAATSIGTRGDIATTIIRAKRIA